MTWIGNMILFMVCFALNQNQNQFYVNALKLCLLQDVSDSDSSSLIGIISIVSILIVIATICLDMQLIKTLRNVVVHEEHGINFALQEAVKVPTRATAFSTVKFFIVMALLIISKLLHFNPATIR